MSDKEIILESKIEELEKISISRWKIISELQKDKINLNEKIFQLEMDKLKLLQIIKRASDLLNNFELYNGIQI